ncbi:ethanolamine ammonia-lyase subunit EutC [Xanthobacter autotrophicus DSM 431]|uniref:ethanolamine ammonia-lyase subunit EutC n=1 Tax=Xanthobacter nonsaccharivorans TaxID=3119912 RepID=UPI00372A1D9D
MIERDPWLGFARHTPARIALGRTGASLPTAEVLRFALAHAQARDAVHTPFEAARVDEEVQQLGFSTLQVASAAPARDVYLRRPDLGRRLSDDSRARVAAAAGAAVDLVLVVADGLSSAAIHAQTKPFLAAFKPWIAREGWSLGPVVIASQARVALGDEVGELLKARALVVLVGERPGLSSPDSLGLYLTYDPKVGRSDAERNCISNVRPDGLAYDLAAFKLAWHIRQALRRLETGVELKDESDLLLVNGRVPLGLGSA